LTAVGFECVRGGDFLHSGDFIIYAQRTTEHLSRWKRDIHGDEEIFITLPIIYRQYNAPLRRIYDVMGETILWHRLRTLE